MVARTQTCKSCQRDFLLEYTHGRPRERCYDCQPIGWRVVVEPARTKLRRAVGYRLPPGVNQWTSKEI
jgi:hypothetical protein